MFILVYDINVKLAARNVFKSKLKWHSFQMFASSARLLRLWIYGIALSFTFLINSQAIKGVGLQNFKAGSTFLRILFGFFLEVKYYLMHGI